MNITRTTEPTDEPITLDEAKAHLRVVDLEDDNAYITTLIAVARRAVEDMTGRTLIDTVFTQSVRDWHACIELLRGNAHTIGSVKYDDVAAVEQTVGATDYGLHSYGDGCAALAFYDEFAEPDLVERPFVDRVRIQFTAGYGTSADDVPESLRQAVLYLVAHLYDNRSPVAIGASVNTMPFTVESLCGPYKIYN